MSPSVFRGFATISFYAEDLAAARDWYTELLGVQPYYAYPDQPAAPAYLEFRVGDDEDELGIIDRRYAPAGAANAPGGAVMHWHVADFAATVDRLLAMGATEYQPVTGHGTEQADGSVFATASVVDPFGNILGVMHNPHYLEILAAKRTV